MSDHYDRYNGMDELLSTNLAEVGTDLIDRQAAFDMMAELQGKASTKAELTGISKAWKKIKRLPSAEPERKTGEWIHREDMDFIDENEVAHAHLMCSECGLIHDFLDWHTAQYNFCPNCGAKMEMDKSH